MHKWPRHIVINALQVALISTLSSNGTDTRHTVFVWTVWQELFSTHTNVTHTTTEHRYPVKYLSDVYCSRGGPWVWLTSARGLSPEPPFAFSTGHLAVQPAAVVCHLSPFGCGCWSTSVLPVYWLSALPVAATAADKPPSTGIWLAWGCTKNNIFFLDGNTKHSNSLDSVNCQALYDCVHLRRIHQCMVETLPKRNMKISPVRNRGQLLGILVS